ncbi:MAG: hypothetical protein AAF471_02410 [Myxococcota bacterium]
MWTLVVWPGTPSPTNPFGDKKCEPVLRQFLNSVLCLKDEERIQHLRIADPHQVPPIEDVKCLG